MLRPTRNNSTGERRNIAHHAALIAALLAIAGGLWSVFGGPPAWIDPASVVAVLVAMVALAVGGQLAHRSGRSQ